MEIWATKGMMINEGLMKQLYGTHFKQVILLVGTPVSIIFSLVSFFKKLVISSK